MGTISRQAVTSGDGQEVTVTVELTKLGGRLEATALIIRSDAPLTRSRVRELPLGEIIRTARARHHRDRRATPVLAPARKGRKYTAEDLDDVAATYRRAYAAGIPVTQAVADAAGISRSAAAKRIMAARAAGKLDAR